MGKIKDGLSRTQTATLQESEIKFLRQMNAKFQAELDKILQITAADFLHYVAVHRFEYPPDAELLFNFKPDQEEDNLEIRIAPPK